MVGYWDGDLRNRFANAAYLTFFAVSPAEMDGMHIRDLLGPDLFALNEPYMVGALAGEVQLFEREIPDPQGGPARYTQASYIPDIRAGRVCGFVALVTDITRRELAEQRVRELEQAQRELLEWMLRAEEGDRGRVAQELHDDTLQCLVGLQLQLERVGQALHRDDTPLAGSLVAEAGSMVTAAVDQLRGLMFDLRPQSFSEHGLQLTLTDMVKRTALAAGCEWSVDVPGLRYPGVVEELVYRSVREAVRSATAHPQVSALTVTVRSDRALLCGTVAWDSGGTGLATEHGGLATTALDAAAQRLRLVGGTMTVETHVQSGSAVRFCVPIEVQA